MTEDYKENLLKYLTGNLEIEQGQNYPNFNENVETLDKNIKKNINSILEEKENAISTVVLGKIYNETYEQYLIYGYYRIDQSNLALLMT